MKSTVTIKINSIYEISNLAKILKKYNTKSNPGEMSTIAFELINWVGIVTSPKYSFANDYFN